MSGTATSAQPALAVVQADLQAVTTLVPGSSALATIAQDIATAQGVLAGIQAAAETAIDGIAARGAALATPGLVGSAADITSAVAEAGTLAQALQATGYLNRMAVNAGAGPGT